MFVSRKKNRCTACEIDNNAPGPDHNGRNGLSIPKTGYMKKKSFVTAPRQQSLRWSNCYCNQRQLHVPKCMAPLATVIYPCPPPLFPRNKQLWFSLLESRFPTAPPPPPGKWLCNLPVVEFSPPPENSLFSLIEEFPPGENYYRKCHFIHGIPGGIVLWKFEHFKLVSKISRKLFKLETWSLVSW